MNDKPCLEGVNTPATPFRALNQAYEPMQHTTAIGESVSDKISKKNTEMTIVFEVERLVDDEARRLIF